MLRKRLLATAGLTALFLAGCSTRPLPLPLPLPLCLKAQVEISLNTGYDQYASALIPVGQKDNEWWVTLDPNPNGTVPRQADVTGLDSIFPMDAPNTRYISTNPSGTAYSPSNPPIPTPTPILYEYTYYFTLPNGASNVTLSLRATADDGIDSITLNGQQLHTFSTGNPGNMNQDFVSLTVNNPAYFYYGPTLNALKIRVRDTHRALTALLVEGKLKYTDCCRRPIQNYLPQSLTFWESTDILTAKTVSGEALTTRLASLSSSSNDFSGADTELYDVFYSDWDGTPNPNGAFITVEAVYPNPLPYGGGLNIAKVQLNMSGGSIVADSLMSFVGLGDNFIPADVVKAIDGNLSTHTTMGNTQGQGNKRLRITLGFPCCGQ